MRLTHKAEAFRISTPTLGGKIYWLEFKDSLTQHDWKPIMSISGDGTERELVDPAASSSSRFYRVRVEPKP